LRDDFYLNLVDWSDTNNLAVALNQQVYIWSASSSSVVKLHDYSVDEDMPASVAWSRLGGQYLATGTHTGVVHLWDTETQKLLRTFEGHIGRVGALSWSNSNMLSSGSKDKSILNRDIREKKMFCSRFESHKQEICGLKWSFDDKYLASGGNDNKLMVWSSQNHTRPD
jgi:cell division cycle 20-like protein 1, cofactor of APC complex